MKNNKLTMIGVTIIALALHNLFYWSARIFGYFEGYHRSITAHWKLFMFLEFLAIASVTADMIIRYDEMETTARKRRLIITATLALLFMTKLLFGVIDLYMKGQAS